MNDDGTTQYANNPTKKKKDLLVRSTWKFKIGK